MKLLLVATALGFALFGVACSAEDSGPYPPVQRLVQCSVDAAPGDPLACPDMAATVDGGVDASSSGLSG